MNNKTILDLTVRLSQALDQNYDVISMESVLSVIAILESTTITKDQLETTRLAKYINQLRRRTKNENLARRSKALLKKWREMVGIQHGGLNETNSNSRFASTSSTVAATPAVGISSATVVGVSDNATVMNFKNCNAKQNFLSQPSSPLAISASKSKGLSRSIHHMDLFSSVASNSIPNSKTTYNNSNLNQSNRLGKKTEALPIAECELSKQNHPCQQELKQQPTSFANLLSGLQTNPIGPTITNKPQNRSTFNLTPSNVKTFIVDNSSNSETTFNLSTAALANPTLVNEQPIIIDIQDSNSDSELNLTEPNKFMKIANTQISTSVQLKQYPCNNTTAKRKKSKKEKEKKKSHDDISQKAGIFNCKTPQPNNIALKHHGRRTMNLEENTPGMVQSRTIFQPMSNISEILSLSNSSMSLVFPGDGISRQLLSGQNSSNVPINDTKIVLTQDISSATSINTLPRSDLTFAGKFTHSISNEDDHNFNCLVDKIVNDTSKPQSKISDAVFGLSSNRFDRFTGNGCNSNESTSNSRISEFDVVDVASISQEETPQALNNSEIEKLSVSKTCKSGTNETYSKVNKNNESLISTVNVAGSTEPNKTSTENKVPKKRGRKKGSKGVDSVIAKEISLSTQMLITSLGGGGKKVKTTKELYAEMQNRKLGKIAVEKTPSRTTAANAASRLESSCSEPSLHSPLTLDAFSVNATTSTAAPSYLPNYLDVKRNIGNLYSDSDTLTSELSHESLSLQKKKIQRSLSIDSTSNSQLPLKINLPTANDEIDNLKTKLHEASKNCESERILEKTRQYVTPIQTTQSIERDYATKLVHCTCRINEVGTLTSTVGEEKFKENLSVDLNKILTENDVKDEADTKRLLVVTEKSPTTESTLALPSVASVNSYQRQMQKSIFDLDFEEDDDPLYAIMAETKAKEERIVGDTQKIKFLAPMTAIVKDEVSNDGEYQSDLKVRPTILLQKTECMEISPSVQPFSCYEVEEDPNCLAKKRFELQTQKITKFHIEALHDCFIPNVNGNWDNAECDFEMNDSTNAYFKDEILDIRRSSMSVNIVPKYGVFVSERINKDISLSFTENFQSKPLTTCTQKLYRIPFLGVARMGNNRYQSKRNFKKRLYNSQGKDAGEIVSNITQDMDFVSYSKKMVTETTIPSDEKCSYDEIVIKDEAKVINIGQSQAINTDSIVFPCEGNNFCSYIDVKHSSFLDNYKSRGRENLCSPDIDTGAMKILNEQNESSATNKNPSRSGSCSTTSFDNEVLTKSKRRYKRSEEKGKKCRKRKRKMEIGNYTEEKSKTRLIKRLKIGINGDFAMERQKIFFSKSLSSEDDLDKDFPSKPNSSSLKQILKTRDEDDDEEQDEDDNSNGLNEEYKDCDDEKYFGDFHEVVTRDILSTTCSGNNHIVLTFKKTSSKTNSIPDAKISPSMHSDVLNRTHQVNEEEKIGIEGLLRERKILLRNSTPNDLPKSSSWSTLRPIGLLPSLNFGKRRISRPMRRKPRKKLENSVKNSIDGPIKLHRQLFFPHEMALRMTNGEMLKIIDAQSCSSSCGEESEYEYFSVGKYASDNSKDGETQTEMNLNVFGSSKITWGMKLNSPTTLNSTSTSRSISPMLGLAVEYTEDFANNSAIADDSSRNEDTKPSIVLESRLPLANNGELLSFNNIFIEPMAHKACDSIFQSTATYKRNDNGRTQNYLFERNDTTELLPSNPKENENCDDKYVRTCIKHNYSSSSKNNAYVKNNIDCDMKSACKYKNLALPPTEWKDQITETTEDAENSDKWLVPRAEYQLGRRAVDEDVNDDNGTNCARIQEFKEWHQVLQLNSYNNDLLTILPYVVLE